MRTEGRRKKMHVELEKGRGEDGSKRKRKNKTKRRNRRWKFIQINAYFNDIFFSIKP